MVGKQSSTRVMHALRQCCESFTVLTNVFYSSEHCQVRYWLHIGDILHQYFHLKNLISYLNNYSSMFSSDQMIPSCWCKRSVLSHESHVSYRWKRSLTTTYPWSAGFALSVEILAFLQIFFPKTSDFARWPRVPLLHSNYNLHLHLDWALGPMQSMTTFWLKTMMPSLSI